MIIIIIIIIIITQLIKQFMCIIHITHLTPAYINYAAEKHKVSNDYHHVSNINMKNMFSTEPG